MMQHGPFRFEQVHTSAKPILATTDCPAAQLNSCFTIPVEASSLRLCAVCLQPMMPAHGGPVTTYWDQLVPAQPVAVWCTHAVVLTGTAGTALHASAKVGDYMTTRTSPVALRADRSDCCHGAFGHVSAVGQRM